jgi:alanine racemase
MARPIQASFDLAALRDNFAIARRLAGAAKVMAVVKANAYGHGLLRVARALADADAFALLELDDAMRLRDAGYRQRMLLLEGFFRADELPVILHHGFSVVIHNDEQIALLGNLRGDRKLEVFVKFNTGMNRLGFPAALAGRVLEQLKALPCVGEVVLMTHFSDAEGVSGIEWQTREFERHVARPGYLRSLANSAALLRFPEARGDWVRPGIMLYGASPLADRTAAQIGLRPAMAACSPPTGKCASAWLPAAMPTGIHAMPLTARRCWSTVCECQWSGGFRWTCCAWTSALFRGRESAAR